MKLTKYSFFSGILALAFMLFFSSQAMAFSFGPPVAGFVTVKEGDFYPSQQFLGRVQAVHVVNLEARVTAFLEQRDFTEGQSVKKGQLLFVLEQGPFEAAVEEAEAAVISAKAVLRNAALTLARAEALLNTPAGQLSVVDADRAAERSAAAALLTARASLKTAKINLSYTEIRAPVSGRIGLSAYSVGNVVSPSSGPLATIVSQNPIYVTFSVPVAQFLALRDKYAADTDLGQALTIKIQLPDNQIYQPAGQLDFVNNVVTENSDTLLMRAVIPNLTVRQAANEASDTEFNNRVLTNGEMVTVYVQAKKPEQALLVPSAAVMSDQAGSYVYVIGAEDKVSQVYVVTGQSSLEETTVLSGLKPGERIVLAGLQNMLPGLTVKPVPAQALAGNSVSG